MRTSVARLRSLVVLVVLALGFLPAAAPGAVAAAKPPAVTELSTTSGPVAGGTKVTITGTSFTADAQVSFGTVPAASLSYVSTKKLVAVAPASAAGQVYVTVTTPIGSSTAVKAARFTFVDPPALASLGVAKGSTKGGTKVTITGTAFTKVSKVLFGTSKGTSLSVSSSTKLTVKTPKHANGWVDVQVVTKYGASPVVAAGRFLFGVDPATLLRVGSFNIRIANGSEKPQTSLEKSWEKRRPVIAKQIVREQLDVVGVQEASAGVTPDGWDSQFQELADELTVKLGEPYALTNTERYCDEYHEGDVVDEGDDEEGEDEDGGDLPGPGDLGTYFEHECIGGAGQSDRILYNTTRLALVQQGAISLDSRPQYADGTARHMTWAIFTDLVTNKQFYFASAHLEPGDTNVSVHSSQAKLILTSIAQRRPAGMPAILVGDLASTKFSKKGNTAHDKFVKAGWADPLGNTYKQKSTKNAFADQLVNVKYSSLNYFKAKPQTLKGYSIGSYVDYILLSSKGIGAIRWETVVDLDSSGAFDGVIPSDHNLITLSVVLP